MNPKLKIVRIADIVSIQKPDPSRIAYWREYFGAHEIFPHPVAVASMGKERYLLLDESSYLAAALEHKLEHIPAQQMILRPNETVDASLVVENLEESHICQFNLSFPRAMLVPAAEKRKQYSASFISAAVTFPDQRKLYLDFRRNKEMALNGYLFYFLNFLERNFVIRDKAPLSELKSTNLKVSHIETIIDFSHLTPDDLLNAARNGFKFPSGMISVAVGPRLLGIDFPIRVLRERAPLREKNRFLIDLLNYRIRSGHPEYFRCGVCLLNRH